MKEFDLGYNSKCLKCGKQLCGCEFRQQKSWQEKFDKEFDCYALDSESQGTVAIRQHIKQFITDIRKHDGEELIKMLSEDKFKQPELNEGLYNSVKDEDIKLIKDYYANK